MASFVYTVLLLQAFAATSASAKETRKIVRKSLSVAADGQIEVEDGAFVETKEQPQENMGALAMLSELEGMIESKSEPDPCRIRTIKKIANEDLLPDLKATRDLAVNQVKDNLAAIDQCNANSVTRNTEIKQKAEAAVEKQRTEHISCRKEQKGKNSTQSSACAELDGYLSTVSVPAEIPPNRPRDPMVTYVTTMSDYFCPKGEKVKEMSEACVSASIDHFKHKATCDKLQATFEAGFCTWRMEVHDSCETSSECYQNMLKVYDGHVSDTKELVEKWKAEFTAIKKILCYSEVWLDENDEKAKKEREEQLKHCEGLQIDTSPMDIDFGTAADQAVCSVDAVEKHPGSEGFVSAEYAGYGDYVAEPIPCLPCTKSTPAPSMPEQPTSAPEPEAEEETKPTEPESEAKPAEPESEAKPTEPPKPKAFVYKKGRVHHAKLHTMKISELKKYARSLGASNDQLDHIDDHHDVKAAMVEFIKKIHDL